MSLESVSPWSDEVEIYSPPRSTAERWRDWIETFKDIYKAAEVLSTTPLVPAAMLGKTADVAAAMMKGYELGMDPLDALANIYVIHGRIGFYAEFMRRRIIQSGHTFRVIESTDNRCIVEGSRKDGGEPQRAQFTAEQARKAGLNLGNYPADKLLARATSRLCRQVFPDVLSGTLIAEDIIDGLIPAGEPDTSPEAVESGPALKRLRKPRPAKAASTQPPEQDAQVAEAADDLLDDDLPPQTGVANGGIPSPRDSLAGEVCKAHRDEHCRDCDAARDDQWIHPRDIEADPRNRIGAEHSFKGDDFHGSEPPEDIHMITDKQMKLLQIRFKERGFSISQRQERLDYAASVIGRAVKSSSELTAAEASTLIDSLET